MLKDQNCFVISCHVMWREVCHFASISNNIHNVKFLRQGLHNTPDLLRKELQQSIDEIDGKYPYILIGYGLCSNGIVGIRSQKSTLVFMKGHDCITFFLGSKEYYSEYFDKHPGTYWYTPGWIETSLQPGKERYEKTLADYIDKYGEDNAEYLMEMEQDWFKEYNNATYVDQCFLNCTKYKEYTKECSDWLGWNYDEIIGSTQLIKDFLDGNWDEDRFLIVKPGKVVVASNDDNIVRYD